MGAVKVSGIARVRRGISQKAVIEQAVRKIERGGGGVGEIVLLVACCSGGGRRRRVVKKGASDSLPEEPRAGSCR